MTISQTKIKTAILYLSAFVMGAFWTDARAAEAHRLPNIVFILADDLGYGDLGCYNKESKIPTPHLDQFAREGMRFTDAHAPSSVCSPTRYALLTGRYAWRSRLQRGVLGPWDKPLIAPKRLTVAALLKEHGYTTACIGKWHLGLNWLTKDGLPASFRNDPMSNVDFTKPIADSPTTRGFDHYFGTFVPNYPPFCFVNDDRTVGIPSVLAKGGLFNVPGPMLPDWKLVDILPELTRHAVGWVESTAKSGQPFFLYLPLTSPHYPVVPAPEFRGKSGAGEYGDFVVQTDWTVGQVLYALKRGGVADNTLVIFTSDNGPEVASEVNPGAYDRVRQFQHSSMGALRGVKRDAWEGGHRVPFLARWPGRIKAGEVSDETMCHVDFMATVAAMLGAKLPGHAAEDSVNVLPVLLGEKLAAPAREATVHHSISGKFAIRQGDWVLIDAPTGDENRAEGEPLWLKADRNYTGHDHPGELYNLREDPAQRHNRFAEKPDIVRGLKALLERYKREGRSTPGTPQKNDVELAATAPKSPDTDKLRDLTAKAQKGDTAMQLVLAVRYRDGTGVTKDDAESLRWAHRAADGGDAEAMDFVGFAYLRGSVIPRNPVIAFGYFKAAAEKSAQAAFNLGQCYFGAQGTEQDIPRAFDYWKKAAAAGHGRAAACAAMAYHSGEGVPPDAVQACRLARRAAELNDPSGLVVLGEMQFLAGEVDAARANWTRASKLKPTGPTGHPAQPSANASSQQGADLLKLIEYRQRQGEPGKFAFVKMPHIHQGYNNCGSTACATFARFQGSTIGGWDFKRLCPSPLGTGTDWGHLLDASAKVGQKWKLITFTPDNDGFERATAFLKSELDAGRPVVVDFKYLGPQYPGGSAGHTLNVAGYIAAENLYILCNPAVATPGLQLITAADLKHYWRSDHYGELSKNVLSRPAIVIEKP